MKRGAIVIAALAVSAWPAQAQWVHTRGEDNPFQGGTTHLAMTVGFTGYTAAFRCTSAEDLSLLLITPERPRPEHLSAIRMVPVEMLAIVDQNTKMTLDSEVDTTPDGDNYRLTAMGPDVAVLLHQAAAGRQRIALAGQMGGKVIWTQSFGLSGSRRAMQPLITACKIAKPSG